MVISIVAGPKFIEFLRRNEFGQQIREDGPQGHVVKRGTPAMGGLLIMLAMAIPFLAFSKHTLPALTAFFVTLGCAAIGFVDDWTKIARRRSLGLAGRWKLVWLAGITVIVGLVVSDRGFSTSIYVPLIDVDVPLSYAWYVLAFFIIAGAANGVNLTDGIDGLAAGTTTIAILTYTAMSLVAALTAVRRGAPADPIGEVHTVRGAGDDEEEQHVPGPRERQVEIEDGDVDVRREAAVVDHESDDDRDAGEPEELPAARKPQ